MTKEEFKKKYLEEVDKTDFPVWDWRDGCLSYEDLGDLAELAWTLLGGEIEKLEESEEDKIKIIKDLEDQLFKAQSDRTYWFDLYNLETAKLIKSESLSAMRQNEIIGLQVMLGERDAEIGRLKKRIEELEDALSDGFLP